MTPAATLTFKCHVSTPTPAVVTVTIDGVATEFTVQPTIQWVPSSTDSGAQEIFLVPDPTKLYNVHGTAIENTFDFSIKAEGSNVLICGYAVSWPTYGSSQFDIVSQPVWNTQYWQPYDITGHGPGLDFEGPGSLQILDGQTVEFVGKITKGTPNPS